MDPDRNLIGDAAGIGCAQSDLADIDASTRRGGVQ
jgi:hypothetical protein